MVHDLMRGKWKTIIIFQLHNGPLSPSELEHSIAGIGQKMLLEQLRELRDYKLVDKTEGSGYPLHTEYFLTERGAKLLGAVRIMQDVGIDYMVENGQVELLEANGILTKK